MSGTNGNGTGGAWGPKLAGWLIAVLLGMGSISIPLLVGYGRERGQIDGVLEQVKKLAEKQEVNVATMATHSAELRALGIAVAEFRGIRADIEQLRADVRQLTRERRGEEARKP